MKKYQILFIILVPTLTVGSVVLYCLFSDISEKEIIPHKESSGPIIVPTVTSPRDSSPDNRGIVLKTKLERAENKCLFASVKFMESRYHWNWSFVLVDAAGKYPPFSPDAHDKVRIVIRNQGVNPFIISATKSGDDGIPLPTTENINDYMLYEKVSSKSELAIYSGEIGAYFRHWKSFSLTTNVPNDSVSIVTSVYFDGGLPDSMLDIYLISTRSSL